MASHIKGDWNIARFIDIPLGVCSKEVFNAFYGDVELFFNFFDLKNYFA
jgi:hypothetical protein